MDGNRVEGERGENKIRVMITMLGCMDGWKDGTRQNTARSSLLSNSNTPSQTTLHILLPPTAHHARPPPHRFPNDIHPIKEDRSDYFQPRFFICSCTLFRNLLSFLSPLLRRGVGAIEAIWVWGGDYDPDGEWCWVMGIRMSG